MSIRDKIAAKFDYYSVGSIGIEEHQSTEMKLTSAIIDLIDLEEELALLKEKMKTIDKNFPLGLNEAFPSLRNVSVSIEVNSDADDKIIGNFPKEFDIVQGINDLAKAANVAFDARAMLSPVPTELGYFNLRVAARMEDRIVTGVVPVWIVPKEKHAS